LELVELLADAGMFWLVFEKLTVGGQFHPVYLGRGGVVESYHIHIDNLGQKPQRNAVLSKLTTKILIYT
jgi:hypothetical protein